MTRKHLSTGNGREPMAVDRADQQADGLSANASPDGDEQQIRELAYGYFVERGCTAGHELDDWLRAEAEVRSRRTGSVPEAATAAA